MTFQRVTIKQLADELGLSPSTVSRALRNHKDISPVTRRAVQELADLREYEPNVFALMLKKQPSNTIGVIVPNISHHFFSSFLGELEATARLSGYQVMIGQSSDILDRERSLLNHSFTSRIDGLVIAISKETTEYEHLERLRRRGLPIVFFDRTCDGVSADTVISDDYMGARQATLHLLAQGCKRLGYIGTQDGHLLLNEVREDGFRDALEENELDISEDRIIKMELATVDQGLDAAFKLLSLPEDQRPDGIFATDDYLAMGILQAAKIKGLRIPEDLAIIGYGNSPITAWTTPTISSIEQQTEKAGKQVFKMLHEQIIQQREQEKNTTMTNRDPDCEVLSTHVIARESSSKRK